MKKRAILPLLCLLLTLCGCEMKTGDDLLKLPKPSKSYASLETELQAMLDSKRGMLYASPREGEYRSSVQLKDLNGDGQDEAIAFFRESAQSNTYYVVIYQKKEQDYQKMGVIRGNAAFIREVEYPVMTEDGKCAISIAWQLMGESTMGLTVATLEGDSVSSLLESEYLDYEFMDMLGDGRQELVLIQNDTNGKKTAKLLGYAPGRLAFLGEAPLSFDMKIVARVKPGHVTGGKTALFVDGKPETGVGLFTDIFLYDSAGFRNIVPETGQNAGYSTYRPVSVYMADANGDGITEVPRAHRILGYEGDETKALYFLDWYAYGEGNAKRVCTTYTSTSEDWQLMIPEGWTSLVTAQKTGGTQGISTTTFSVYGASNTVLLRIYRLSYEASKYLKNREDLHILRETGNAIYAAEIPAEASASPLALSMEEVAKRFRLIVQGWTD